MVIKWLRYARWEEVQEFEALGWRRIEKLQCEHPGDFHSTIMEWDGEGEPQSISPLEKT